jgi:hypothetical protein
VQSLLHVRAPTRRARHVLPIAVALVALLAPAGAGAHTRAPAVALDVLLRVTHVPAGVRAEVIDGNRDLRLSVDPSLRLLVRGLIGEPLLRFSPDGVWVNRQSPTAAADRIVPRRAGGGSWLRLTSGHTLMWHDHRLAPPRSLRAGSTAPWSLPVVIGGRTAMLTGSFERARRPAVWTWIVGALAALALLAGVAVRMPEARGLAASVLAALAALAALSGSAGFAVGDAISRTGRWFEVGAAGVLAIAAIGSLTIRDRSVRGWVTTLVGAVAAALSLGTLGVFWHGVVISSLPPDVARLSTAVAVVAGLAAAVLSVAGDEREQGR